MKVPKRRYNPKREIVAVLSDEGKQRLRDNVRYGGNPEHKRNPGDFGLTPPASPRRDKTLCDVVGIFHREVALEHLRRGIERGLVSTQFAGDWPQNIWSLTDDGRPLEAQLENVGQGVYHGYPLPESDPFADVVREAWRTRGDS